ncbi:aminopeptidase P family protein [bacterium]|nr:aminopeptidase P family protein [bacterium]
MKRIGSILFISALLQQAAAALAQTPAILPLRDRAEVENRWLQARLEETLPEIMRREQIDMWLIICREYNEDPVFLTLTPAPTMASRRLTMLVICDTGDNLERLTVSKYGMGPWYEGVWDSGTEDQWDCLASVIEKRNPRRIGINVSDTFAFADGLSASLHEKLKAALGAKLSGRLVSAENLCIGWLETRHPGELETYHHIVRIAHGIIAQAFSNEVITPGVTSTGDVCWWIRQRILDLGLGTWFQPSVSIQRRDGAGLPGVDEEIIQRGDLLHCDVGIVYLRLCTDTQEHAWVCLPGETDAPEGMKAALRRGNRLQDILTAEFVTGRSGNEILLAALRNMKREGLQGSIYTHPLGFHGHAAGPTIGLWDRQEAIPGKGDYPLFPNTCYAIELNVKCPLPEWEGRIVQIGLEQDAVFTGGVIYLDGRQTDLHLIY